MANEGERFNPLNIQTFTKKYSNKNLTIQDLENGFTSSNTGDYLQRRIDEVASNLPEPTPAQQELYQSLAALVKPLTPQEFNQLILELGLQPASDAEQALQTEKIGDDIISSQSKSIFENQIVESDKYNKIYDFIDRFRVSDKYHNKKNSQF